MTTDTKQEDVMQTQNYRRNYLQRKKEEANNRCINCNILINPNSTRCFKCARKFYIKENHYNWQGGISLNTKQYRKNKYLEIKKESNNRCIKCDALIDPKSTLCVVCGNQNKWLGKKFSAEHKENCRRAKLGTRHTIEAIEKIKQSRAGKCLRSNNPAWKGGRSYKGYIYSWKTIRKRIKERDSYQCQLCKYPHVKNKTDLEVHHMDFNTLNNNYGNLITLCMECHHGVHKTETRLDQKTRNLIQQTM